MKLFKLFLLFCCFSVANAANYSLVIEEVAPGLYQNSNGVAIGTDLNCPIRESTPITLHYANSNQDTFTYSITEQYVVDGKIEEVKTTSFCNVVGVIGLKDGAGYPNQENNSLPIYDLNSKMLYLYDIRMYENLRDINKKVSFAVLRLNDNQCFNLDYIEF